MTDGDTDPKLRSRRIPFRQRVLISPRDGSERRYERAVDLSFGGMFIATILPMRVGEVLDLEMHLEQLCFTAAARVVWVRATEVSDDEPVGMAVSFLDLNSHQKRLIHRQITNHTQGGGHLLVGTPPRAGSSADTSGSSSARSAQTTQTKAEAIWDRVKSKFRR